MLARVLQAHTHPRAHGGDVVERVSGHVDDLEFGRDRSPQFLQELRVPSQALAGLTALLVANHTDALKTPVPLVRDVVGVFVPGSTFLRKPLRALDEQIEKLLLAEPRFDEAQSIELVSDHDIRVGIEQRSEERMAAARITDEHAVGFESRKRVAVPATAERGVQVAQSHADTVTDVAVSANHARSQTPLFHARRKGETRRRRVVAARCRERPINRPGELSHGFLPRWSRDKRNRGRLTWPLFCLRVCIRSAVAAARATAVEKASAVPLFAERRKRGYTLCRRPPVEKGVSVTRRGAGRRFNPPMIS